MLKKLYRFNKFKDYFSYKESEVRTAFTISIVILFILINIGFYKEMMRLTPIIQNLLLCLLGGFIGLLGFSLSGIAFMIGLFQKQQVQIIEKINGKGSIEKIMSSFAFLAYNIGFVIICIIVAYLITGSRLELPTEIVFYLLIFIFIYIILFCIFYTIALVFNCICLFSINNIYTTFQEKDIFDKANEVRIDYILSILLEICKISKEDFLKDLNNKTDNMSEKDKKDIKRYFEQYYDSVE